MRLYYICECCREIYRDYEVEGPQGAAEISGLCPDCQAELGLEGSPAVISQNISYH